jgi:hypothetical protein
MDNLLDLLISLALLYLLTAVAASFIVEFGASWTNLRATGLKRFISRLLYKGSSLRLVSTAPNLQSLRLVPTVTNLQSLRLVSMAPNLQSLRLVPTVTNLQSLHLVSTAPISNPSVRCRPCRIATAQSPLGCQARRHRPFHLPSAAQGGILPARHRLGRQALSARAHPGPALRPGPAREHRIRPKLHSLPDLRLGDSRSGAGRSGAGQGAASISPRCRKS